MVACSSNEHGWEIPGLAGLADAGTTRNEEKCNVTVDTDKYEYWKL